MICIFVFNYFFLCNYRVVSLIRDSMYQLNIAKSAKKKYLWKSEILPKESKLFKIHNITEKYNHPIAKRVDWLSNQCLRGGGHNICAFRQIFCLKKPACVNIFNIACLGSCISKPSWLILNIYVLPKLTRTQQWIKLHQVQYIYIYLIQWADRGHRAVEAWHPVGRRLGGWQRLTNWRKHFGKIILPAPGKHSFCRKEWWMFARFLALGRC